MNKQFVIEEDSPLSNTAVLLMEELSAALRDITDDDGKASFDPQDVCSPRSVFAVIKNDEGVALGCGALRPIDEDTAELKRMYSRYRGLGIGSSLLGWLEDYARKMHYKQIWLETRRVNKAAVSFYISKGYVEITSYGKYIERPEAVCFEKRL